MDGLRRWDHANGGVALSGQRHGQKSPCLRMGEAHFTQTAPILLQVLADRACRLSMQTAGAEESFRTLRTFWSMPFVPIGYGRKTSESGHGPTYGMGHTRSNAAPHDGTPSQPRGGIARKTSLKMPYCKRNAWGL